jgi:hypothetical protein
MIRGDMGKEEPAILCRFVEMRNPPAQQCSAGFPGMANEKVRELTFPGSMKRPGVDPTCGIATFIRMPTKLTLSLPEETIAKAKRYARKHGTSVSALFARSVEEMSAADNQIEEVLKRFPDMRKVVGISVREDPFDERSKHIRRKHG